LKNWLASSVSGQFKTVPIINLKLAEIGTGEGKSIVLATLACYFAI